MIVRDDLPRGVEDSQVGHAATEACGVPPTIMVVLRADNEQHLRDIAKALGENSLTHKLIVEDAGPFAGQATAIGIEPTHDRKAVGKVVSSIPLVR